VTLLIDGIGGRRKSGKDTIGAYLVEHHGYTRVAFGDRIKQITKAVFAYPDEQLIGSDAQKATPDPRGADPAFWTAIRAAAEEHRGLFESTARGYSGDSVAVFHAMTDRYLRPLGASLTPRKVLQYLGSQWRDACNQPLMWVEWTWAVIQELAAKPSTYNPLHGVLAAETKVQPRFVITDVRFVHEVAALSQRGARVGFVDAERRLGPMPADEHESEPRIERFRMIVDYLIDNNGTLEELSPRIEDLWRDRLA